MFNETQTQERRFLRLICILDVESVSGISKKLCAKFSISSNNEIFDVTATDKQTLLQNILSVIM